MIKILPSVFAMKINFFRRWGFIAGSYRERSSQTFPKPNEDTDGIYIQKG